MKKSTKVALAVGGVAVVGVIAYAVWRSGQPSMQPIIVRRVSPPSATDQTVAEAAALVPVATGLASEISSLFSNPGASEVSTSEDTSQISSGIDTSLDVDNSSIQSDSGYMNGVCYIQ